jgi:hypothetical protein
MYGLIAVLTHMTLVYWIITKKISRGYNGANYWLEFDHKIPLYILHSRDDQKLTLTKPVWAKGKIYKIVFPYSYYNDGDCLEIKKEHKIFHATSILNLEIKAVLTLNRPFQGPELFELLIKGHERDENLYLEQYLLDCLKIDEEFIYVKYLDLFYNKIDVNQFTESIISRTEFKTSGLNNIAEILIILNEPIIRAGKKIFIK